MNHAAQFALAHGAALLFTWILLQQAGVPIPSAPLLIAVGSLASNGRLRLVPSLVAAFTACLLADGVWYRVGRRGWSKNHRFCRPNSDWKNRVLSLIWRHSGAAMLFAKFIVGSNVVSLLAGQALEIIDVSNSMMPGSTRFFAAFKCSCRPRKRETRNIFHEADPGDCSEIEVPSSRQQCALSPHIDLISSRLVTVGHAYGFKIFERSLPRILAGCYCIHSEP